MIFSQVCINFGPVLQGVGEWEAGGVGREVAKPPR